MTICREHFRSQQIHAVVKAAMQRERAGGWSARYGFDRDAHFAYIDKIIGRVHEPLPLQDDVTRVGREPLRKLSAGDRLVKPVLTARQYGIGTRQPAAGHRRGPALQQSGGPAERRDAAPVDRTARRCGRP